MIQQLTVKGVNVPNGFPTTAYAYQYFIEKADLEKKLRELLADLDVEDVKNLQKRGKQARTLILDTPFPAELEQAIVKASHQMCDRYAKAGEDYDQLEEKFHSESERYTKEIDVAVRSSATAEDLLDASFAGQQETYLNIYGDEAVLEACHKCFASIFTDNAISYRTIKGFDHFNIALSVCKK